MSARAYIDRLGLEPHPEGGHYRRFFTSPVSLETPRGRRPTMTAIHYLLQAGDFSAWHRLRGSEIWHWQDGGKLRIYRLDPLTGLQSTMLGQDETLDLVIAPDTWFAAEPTDDTSFVLCACTVTPGFDFEDFEVAQPKKLCLQFPAHRDLINQLSRRP